MIDPQHSALDFFFRFYSKCAAALQRRCTYLSLVRPCLVGQKFLAFFFFFFVLLRYMHGVSNVDEIKTNYTV
jgi:hypothetical protein